MFRKWLEIIFDHKISLRERMFRLVTGISMVALVFILVLGRSGVNLFILPLSLAYIYIAAKISIKKECINAGAAAIVVLLLLLYPVVFFTGGGLYGGVPEWFVLCFIYISITLEGRRKGVFFLLCIVETVICYYLAYHYPDLVMPNTMAQAYFDSARSVILVGFLTSILLLFQNYLYEEENKLTKSQKKEIEELNQAENHFFSSMSHEIRTPINTIIGLNEMILRGDISDEVAENARNIQGASKMLLTLINDILDLSKIKSGKMEIVNVSYETGELFSEIVNMIWIKAREKGLEPLANIILLQMTKESLETEAQPFVDSEKGVETPADAIAGAMDILAENISDEADYRKYIRDITMNTGKIISTAKDPEKESVYEMYYEFEEGLAKLAGHRILALNRGESEKILTVKIEAPTEKIQQYLEKKIISRLKKEIVRFE